MGNEKQHCGECGADNTADAKFCSQCAAPLASIQQQEIDALEAAAGAGPADAQPAGAAAGFAAEEDRTAVSGPSASGGFVSRKAAVVIGVGIAVLVAVVAVAAALTLGGPGDTKHAPAKPAASSSSAAPNDAASDDTDGDGTPDAQDADPYSANTTTAPVDGASTDPIDNAPSADDDTSVDDSAQAGPQQKTVSVGEAATDDDVTFKVLSLEAVSSIPTGEFSDGPITPKPGAKLVKAVVRWKNNMSKSADIFCGEGSAILLDQNDRNFDPMNDQIDIAGNNVCGEDVQPGFTQTVTLAFQMPKDSKTSALALWNSDAEDDFDGQQTDVLVLK